MVRCTDYENCFSCFDELTNKDIDWATLPDQLDCQSILIVMKSGNHCIQLVDTDMDGQKVFCNAITACVNPNREHHESMIGPNVTNLDCSKLLSCDFDGIHKQFLGDGICHENLPGCYNSEICNWDMGDCCSDTCKEKKEGSTTGETGTSGDGSSTNAIHCGSEGWSCRDPNSIWCDNSLSTACGENQDWEPLNTDDQFDNDNNNNIPLSKDACPNKDETSYRLIMYDSFGDGWEETTLEIVNKLTPSQKIYSGALRSGSMAMTLICLSNLPNCYTVTTKGGIWGKEVSWEIKPYQDGTPSIASGGAPMECEFAVAGSTCDTTCHGRTTQDPTKDPEYKEFKTLYQCILNKCPFQVDACNNDATCTTCLQAEDMTPEYCFGIDTFLTIIDCALCSCTDDNKKEYCINRDIPHDFSNNDKKGDDGNSDFALCTPMEIMQGGEAILEFSKCSQFDEVSMLLTEFDQNHFGNLDAFEACAHEYHDRTNHGGHTAQSCMDILIKATTKEEEKENDGTSSNTNTNTNTTTNPEVIKAIQELAKLLYNDGQGFCDCAIQANQDCPLCSSFMNFKTLLYESVDACIALDEIDCAAWNEFFSPCNENMKKQFINIQFENKEQCDYVTNGCGGAGTFPSFRHLDCDVNHEVTKESWDFYQSYAKNCLKQEEGDDDNNDKKKTDNNNNNNTPMGPPPPSPPPPQPNGTNEPPQPVAPPPPPPPTQPSAGRTKARTPYVPPEKRGKNFQPSGKTSSQTQPESGGGIIPPSSEGKEGGVDVSKKKKSHFWRNLFWLFVFGCGGYYYYKKFGLSLDGCEGIYYFCGNLIRRCMGGGPGAGRYMGGGRGFGGGDSMYSGLAMESSTSFEPAFLPPAPSAVDNMGGGSGSSSTNNSGGNYYI